MKPWLDGTTVPGKDKEPAKVDPKKRIKPLVKFLPEEKKKLSNG